MADVTTTEQIIREAPDIEAYKLGLLESAKALTNTPLDLPSYQVAGFSPDQMAAFDQARAGIGAYQPYLQQGSASMGQATGLTQQAKDLYAGSDTRNQFPAAQQAMQQGLGVAGQMGAASAMVRPGYNMVYDSQGQYDPRSVSAFMDPYQKEVIQNAMDEINRQAGMTANQQNARAVASGAFGGSRAALERTELDRNTSQVRNQTMANLLSQGYTQAQAAAMTAYEQQKQRALAGGQAMGNLAATQAGILGQQAGLYQAGASGLGNLASQQSAIGQGIAQGIGGLGAQLSNIGVQQAALGQAAQQMGQSDVNMLYNIGQQQQAYNQSILDAQRNTALQQAMSPYQQLGFLSDIYKGAPSSQSSITAASAPTPSALQTAAGLGIAGLAAASGAKKAGIF